MFSFIRRLFTAIFVASVVATIFRVRGKGGVPPRTGGWREVSEAELS